MKFAGQAFSCIIFRPLRTDAAAVASQALGVTLEQEPSAALLEKKVISCLALQSLAPCYMLLTPACIATAALAFLIRIWTLDLQQPWSTGGSGCSLHDDPLMHRPTTAASCCGVDVSRLARDAYSFFFILFLIVYYLLTSTFS